ncbi:hypothetical protein [Bacillus alkalicellulosilyticus]|uniref:hypothetical protein n=1 Tax=Alkalihalobacterium alkalicellulosilyticum TaxID=1912214 RepID=UPI001FE84AD4|nr:hypothetical protein [Bacillus alkalicellulosilyticus]
MDKQMRAIIEDLMPLYQEGLLSEDTTKWVEEQADQHEEVHKLIHESTLPLPKEDIQPNGQVEEMMKSIKRKLALFQILFMGISFFLAIQTSMLNENFGFILWYGVLGMVTYLFYKDPKMVFYISFLPILFWSISINISDYRASHMLPDLTFFSFISQTILGSMLVASIHYAFAVVGNLIAYILLKLKERG